MSRRRTVLLMWEYGCAYSPVWSRGDDLDPGPIDVADLGADAGLRDDLAAWNEALETAADPDGLRQDPGPAWWHARRVEAFALALRLQQDLGAEWTVWCAAGGGDGGLDGEALRTHHVRNDEALLLLHDGGLAVMSPPRDPALDLPAALRGQVGAWRRGIPPDRRQGGLALAGRLQDALPGARVLWFGGQDARRR